MGVARARHLEPLQESEAPMTRAALVIGGGIAGIQAATDLAVQGFPVTLVEKSDHLGGRLAAPNLKHLYPNRRLASEVLAEKIERLERSGARVAVSTEVKAITGYVGNFKATLDGEVSDTLDIGAIILAHGADLHRPDGEFGFGEMENVVTSEDFERACCETDGPPLVDGKLPESASFILCVGSRDPDGFTGCSRYCCPTAIKQAILLAERGIDTTIFYRDIRTISTGAEEMYREARGKGVLFVRIPPGSKPEVIGEGGRVTAVRCYDDLLARRLEVPSDLVVLSVGMRARQPETKVFHEMLKCSIGLDGFYLERHPELAPVETAVEGVLIAGTVHGPKDVVDTVAQASAAAAKASVFLAYDAVKLDPAVAVVDPDACRGCGTCVDLCEFQGPKLVETAHGWVAEINPSLCKGCGTCASWCPSGAIKARHFTDRQVHAMIDAFFEQAPDVSPLDAPATEAAPAEEVH
jgi:heterodisulfide reductase subunit A